MKNLDAFWTKVGRILTDWRLLGVLFVLAICIALGVAISAASEARDATETANRAIEADRVKSNADTRKAQIVVYGQCFRQDDGRRRLRAYMAESVRLAAESALPGAPDITAEQRVALDKVAATIVDAGKIILPDIDCNELAPLPPNLTRAEKAALPTSELGEP
jgi:hypothetical protein